MLLTGLLGVLFVGVSKSPTPKPPPAAKTTRSLFGQKGNMSQFAVSQVSSQLDKMERENKELRDKVEQLSDKK